MVPPPDRPGALVLSLDFELAWGVFDSRGSEGAYRSRLVGARSVIPRILEAFAAYDVAATWATVGMLFAESREDLEAHAPEPHLRPSYLDPRRDPYRVQVGRDEHDDPLHYAPTLVRLIAATPRQEIGTHTFAHYYCLEPGQTAVQFEADLRAAVAIAAARGIALRSLVLPRHQVRPDYLPAVARAGLRAHRTNEANVLARPRATGRDPLAVKVARRLDAYLPLSGANLVPWSDTAPDALGLVDVRESRFLRPFERRLRGLEPIRIARIAHAMRLAAARGAVFHVWWHPHNFGVDQDENLANLRVLLEAFARLRDGFGMVSLSMGEVADRWQTIAPTSATQPA